MLSLTRLPGTELLGIGPNWVLIWLVVWSFKRSVFESVVVGFALGLIQDGLTSGYPSHVISLVIAAFFTARVYQRQRKDSLIAVILIVFGMAILAQMSLAVQYSMEGLRPLLDIWIDYHRVALSSAILSSLWTPVFYYPLKNWYARSRSLGRNTYYSNPK
jgi:rod shape-determining protein MreD